MPKKLFRRASSRGQPATKQKETKKGRRRVFPKEAQSMKQQQRNGNGNEQWLALIPIRFTKPSQLEKALRTMVFSGMVEYTGTPGVYKVPPHTLEIFKKNNIAYEPTIPELKGKV